MTNQTESGRSQELHTPILFYSTMDGAPWGGSEEIWWETANRLLDEGTSVRACVEGWQSPHRHILQLQDRGADIYMRPHPPSLASKVLRKLRRQEGSPNLPGIERWIKRNPPSLIVLNEKYIHLDYALIEMFQRNGWPYVIVVHANSEEWWPEDTELNRYINCIDKAERVWFVSEGNKRLARKQFGKCVDRAEIIRNPFGVPTGSPAPFPSLPAETCLQISSVGRLDPRQKAQDLLIEALASPPWRTRNWHLNFYGDGPHRALLHRLVEDYELEDRVTFHGHVPVNKIFGDNHILAHVSRSDGLPIVIVEAMLSRRAALVTNIAGNAEFIQDGVSGFVAEAPALSCVLEALERLWNSRGKLEEMGLAAEMAARRSVPDDPTGVFVEELKATCDRRPG